MAPGAAAGARARGDSRKKSSARGEFRPSGDLGRDLEAILEGTSRLARTQGMLALLDRLPSDQFGAVYEAISESPMSELRRGELSLVLQAWAERDPLAALGHLQEFGAEDWERETTVRAWAAMDPQSAFAWATEAPDEGKINNWIVGALRGIAATSPELARDFLGSLEDGETRRRGLSTMEPYVMQYGFDYASAWIDGIGEPGLQNAASRRFADELVELDPARAGEWNAGLSDRDTRRAVSETVSDRWARRDLEGAKAWVNSLPEDTRTEAAEGVARHYARDNPSEAAQWLVGLGNNPDLDGARRIFIDESFRRDPEVSLNFVDQLANKELQRGYYHRYLGSWMRRDAGAARAWAENNTTILPESVVKRVLR